MAGRRTAPTKGMERDLKQEFLDDLTGWRETPYPFWTEEQIAAASRHWERHRELYPLGLEVHRARRDRFDVYYIMEWEDEPQDVPPNTLIQVIPDHYLDPAIDAYFLREGEKPPPEVWVRGRGALLTEGRLSYMQEALTLRGVTLENRVRLNPGFGTDRPGLPHIFRPVTPPR